MIVYYISFAPVPSINDANSAFTLELFSTLRFSNILTLKFADSVQLKTILYLVMMRCKFLPQEGTEISTPHFYQILDKLHVRRLKKQIPGL